MSVRITRIEGAADGLRFGAGYQLGRGTFEWSYDRLNDRVRLWRNPVGWGRWKGFEDADCAGAVRVALLEHFAAAA